MIYISNILKVLNNNYKDSKPSKKAISESELKFVSKLIKQIDDFAKRNNKIPPSFDLYKEFKESKLSQAKFIRKKKIKRHLLKSTINKFENVSKYQQVQNDVIKDYENLRKDGKEVHYWHLQRMARVKAQQLGLKRKCNSLSFINTIKKRYRIVSKKSTVQKKEGLDEEAVKKAADDFVNKVNGIVSTKQIPPNRVFNSDQTGINYEISTKRSLEFKNTKHVFSAVKKPFNTTHSYTLQIYLNQSGKLGKTLFLVLREPKGIGPVMKRRIEEVTDKCSNVKVVSSQSGHISGPLLNEWINLFKNENNVVNEDLTLLIWDDLTTQRSKNFEIKDRFITENIPPHCTKYCQPLDTRFNLQYKKFYTVLANDLKFVVNFDKYWIIKLNSIVYNQLSNPVFSDLIKYS